MSYDLRRGLDALAAEERAAAGDLPVDALRTRAHRRRTVRTAAASGLAVAVVAAVAVAAAALPGRLQTPPAGTPTPTVTSPAPDPAFEWPTLGATLDGPLPGCGDPLPQVLHARAVGGPRIDIQPVVQADPIPVGGVAELDVTLTAPADLDFSAQVPRVLLTRDGVVVAATDGDDGFRYSSDDTTLTFPSLLIDLVDCAGDPLPAGVYETVVVVPLQPGSADAPRAGEEVLLAGGPYLLTLDAPTDGSTPRLADLTLSLEGLGPLRLGLAPDTSAVRWDGTACAGTDVPGRWVAAYPAGENAIGGASLPFTVQVLDDRVVRVEVHTPGPRTISGIQVGSTLADVRALHPELTLLSADGDVEAWGVTDGEHTFAVEVAANPPGGGLWSDAEVGRVLAMVAAAGPYDHPAWGADTCG
jgi:hypothetical protein